jgi:N-methylhydantoinase A
VRTILSGPAGGVVGAGYVAELAGLERVISFDMGGTSTDVALLEGELPVTTEGAVGEIPIAVPMLDIHSVGAGGGSVAWFDRGGALRVGPASAGADPGPVCYGRGEDPTVTDAHLVLGRLDPERFLGGEWRLDAPRAERYLERARRGRGFRDLKEFAAGILAVANATMERAMRVISIERGHDPRAFTLVAFGGAGGLHAAELASALRIPRVLVPPFPGALSALGMLRSDVVKDYSRTVLLPVDDTGGKRTLAPKLRRAFRPLIETARHELAREGFSPGRQRLLPRLDLRYRGQGYEITVPYNRQAVSPVPKHRDGRVGRHLGFLDAFHRAHERRYGYADPARPVEVVTVRLRAVGITSKPSLERARRRSRTVRARPHRTAPVWFAGRLMPTAFFLREELLRGQRISGPAVVAEYSATTVVPPRWQLGVDAYENLILESAAGRW